MENNNKLYKVLAAIFVVSTTLFTVLLFTEIRTENKSITLALYTAGSILPAIFSAALIFWISSHEINKQVIVKKVEKATSESEEENKEDEDTPTSEEMNEADNELRTSILSVLKGQDSPESLSDALLKVMSKAFSAVQSMVFIYSREDEKFYPAGSYAFYSDKPVKPFGYGEGINGQVAKNQELLLIDNVPEGYITVLSGLGNSSPKHLAVFPIIFEGKTIAVFELASFGSFPDNFEQLYKSVHTKIAQTYAKFIQPENE